MHFNVGQASRLPAPFCGVLLELILDRRQSSTRRSVQPSVGTGETPVLLCRRRHQRRHFIHGWPITGNWWLAHARRQIAFRSNPAVERPRPCSPSLLGPSPTSESATVPPPSPWPAACRAPASRSDNPVRRDVTRALDAGPARRFPFR